MGSLRMLDLFNIFFYACWITITLAIKPEFVSSRVRKPKYSFRVDSYFLGGKSNYTHGILTGGEGVILCCGGFRGRKGQDPMPHAVVFKY